MNKDAIIGTVIIFFGLAFITYLTLWSRKIIERIAKKRSATAREILKDFHHGE